MLAQIGLAEKEVTNSMRNAVTQAANVKALQDRLKFDVSSQSAKLKQSALDYNTGLQMKYKDFIQTYMDSNEDKRKKEIEEWIEDNWSEYDDDNDDGFKKALNDHIKEVYDMDMAAAKKRYKAISDIIESHSDDTQKYIKEFDDANGVFSFHPNNSDVVDNKSSFWNADVFSLYSNKAILDSINNHSNKTQEYTKGLDYAKAFNFYSNNSDDLDNNNSDVVDNKSSFWNANAFSLYPSNSDGLDNKIKKLTEDSQGNHYNNSAFIKAFNEHKEEVYDKDMAAAKEKDKAIKRLRSILDSVESLSNKTQEYTKEFNANPFGFHPNKAILDSINNHSNKTQKYIGEFDYASVWKIIGPSIMKTNAIIGEFFKNLFSKGGEG
jgi:hypothetical protein